MYILVQQRTIFTTPPSIIPFYTTITSFPLISMISVSVVIIFFDDETVVDDIGLFFNVLVNK